MKSIKQGIKLMGLGLTLAAFMAVATPAGAGQATIKSTVTGKQSPIDPFVDKGFVKSKKRACERGREVRLFRVEDGPDAGVGSDKTDSGGLWKVKLNVFSDGASYYAKAKVKKTDRFTCKAAISPKFEMVD
jgi:hypothetical protein